MSLLSSMVKGLIIIYVNVWQFNNTSNNFWKQEFIVLIIQF